MKHLNPYDAEGVFQIAYPDDPHSGAGQSTLLLIVRGSDVFGSDQFGGVYSGQIAWTELCGETYLFSAHIYCEVPPAGKLVMGLEDHTTAGVTIAGAIVPAQRTQQAAIEVNGRTIDVEIQYVGALPHLGAGSITGR